MAYQTTPFAADKPGAVNLSASLERLVAERHQVLEDAGIHVPHNDATCAVLIGSNFVFEQLLKAPDFWRAAIADEALNAHSKPERFAAIAGNVKQAASKDELMRILREQKTREMARIAWRDLAGFADLDETLSDTTRLADCLIQAALYWCCHNTNNGAASFKTPSLEMVVMGLGKLGGEELNFSSDVDLVFAYRNQTTPDKTPRFSAEEWFSRCVRQLVQTLDAMTSDGYVYRVDLRLRPHGEAGRPALSQTAMEEYFQREGRDWERYAWIKARPVAGAIDFGAQLIADLRPFVFRRYLDWSALEALRELKAQVVLEVKRRGLENDIKLGPGGIREIEFIAQAFQLIHGGREPALRDRRIITTLERLAERDLLTPSASAELIKAHRFLRCVENRLQMMDDRQTHRLPSADTEQARLAAVMGYATWRDFQTELHRIRTQVHTHFKDVFNWQDIERTATSSGTPAEADVWNDGMDPDQAHARLTELGFNEPEQAAAALAQFRRSNKVRRMDARGRQRLDAFMPRLFAGMQSSPVPDRALPRLLKVIDAITQRSVYLTMMLENPPLIERLGKICGASGWMAAEISRRPMLLEELLAPSDATLDYGDAALQAELSRALGASPTDDLEHALDALAEFKHAGVFQVALAQLSGALSAQETGQRLSALARAVLDGALQLAAGDNGFSGLSIVAYGRLGAGELNYDSDLDLVFLYDAEAGGDSAAFTRQARRLTHLLTAPTPAGRLYEIDTRLRPDGRAGLLVSPISAYRAYQMEQAWTWELQALVRARFLIGNRHLRAAFARIRREVLARPRERVQLKEDVHRMRVRMGRADHGDDLKLAAGGLADIEFLVQFHVLASAAEHPALIEETGTLALIDRLARENVLPQQSADALSSAYRALLEAQQRRTLKVIANDGQDLLEHQQTIKKIWMREFDT